MFINMNQQSAIKIVKRSDDMRTCDRVHETLDGAEGRTVDGWRWKSPWELSETRWRAGSSFRCWRICEDPRGLNRAGGVASQGDRSAKMATVSWSGRAADSASSYWSVGRVRERSDWSKRTGQTCRRSSCATNYNKSWYSGQFLNRTDLGSQGTISKTMSRERNMIE